MTTKQPSENQTEQPSGSQTEQPFGSPEVRKSGSPDLTSPCHADVPTDHGGDRINAPAGCPTPDFRTSGLPDPSLFPPPAELTSHQPPALLVAEVLAVEADGGSVRLDTHAGLDLLQMTESCAQTVAVLLGAELRQRGGPAASGMLVGVKDMGATRTVQPGENVRCTARLAHALDPFRLYAVTITAADGSVLLDGEIKTMSTGGAA